MTVNCKHPDWQAEVSCGPVRPGGRISPGRTGNIGLFVGTGLRSLKRESSILRWCYTFWGFPGRGARSVVLYSIKSIFKSTLPIVQRSELRCFSLVSSINYRQELNSDADSAIVEYLQGDSNSQACNRLPEADAETMTQHFNCTWVAAEGSDKAETHQPRAPIWWSSKWWCKLLLQSK